jgi:hypothetical protein
MAKKKKKSKKSKRKSARRDIDFDEAEKKQKELEARSSGEYHEIKQGKNFFYICPPWADDVKSLWREVQQHGLGLVCPKHSGYDKDCRICIERKKAARKGNTEFVDEFRLASRGFMNAIRKEDIKKGGPVKILGVPGGVFEQIVDHVTDERVNISDPEAAVFVMIKRKGKGKATRYSPLKFSDPQDISEWITDDVYEELDNLDEIRSVQPATVEEQRKAISKFLKGDADDDQEFEDEDFEDEDLEGDSEEDELFDEPDDDLDDDDLELDEDEDEEEDEPPPKKKKKSKKSKKSSVDKKAKKGSKGKKKRK